MKVETGSTFSLALTVCRLFTHFRAQLRRGLTRQASEELVFQSRRREFADLAYLHLDKCLSRSSSISAPAGRKSEAAPRQIPLALSTTKHHCHDHHNIAPDTDDHQPTLSVDAVDLFTNTDALHKYIAGPRSLLAVAASDADFLDHQPEFDFQAVSWIGILQSLCFTNNALASLHRLALPVPDAVTLDQANSPPGLSIADEKFLANLEHLLLRLRGALVQILVCKSIKLAEDYVAAWHRQRRQQVDKQSTWFSEWPSGRRPLNACWPWNIRPSVLVLWGVCWKFWNNEFNFYSHNVQDIFNMQNGQDTHNMPREQEIHNMQNEQERHHLQSDQDRHHMQNNHERHQLQNEQGMQNMQDLHSLFLDEHQLNARVPRQALQGNPDILHVFRQPPDPNIYRRFGSQEIQHQLAQASITVANAQSQAHGYSSRESPNSPFSHVTRRGSAVDRDVLRLSAPAPPNSALPEVQGGAASQSQEYNTNVPFATATDTSPADQYYPTNAGSWGTSNWVANNLASQFAYNGQALDADALPWLPDTFQPQLLQQHQFAQQPPPVTSHYATTLDAPFPPYLNTAITLNVISPSHPSTANPDSLNSPIPFDGFPPPGYQIMPEEPPTDYPLSPTSNRSHSPHLSSDQQVHGTMPADREAGRSDDDSARTTTPETPRVMPRNENNQIICTFSTECKGLTFLRKCEWTKHMDKHDRPHICREPGCDNLRGFTYYGGLLRHQREVHKAHGGPKQTFMCPHPDCKRHKGSGFTRKENLNEHCRRMHPEDSTNDVTSPSASRKRKRASASELQPMAVSAAAGPSVSRDREMHESAFKTESVDDKQSTLAQHEPDVDADDDDDADSEVDIDKDEMPDAHKRFKADLETRDMRIRSLESELERMKAELRSLHRLLPRSGHAQTSIPAAELGRGQGPPLR